MNRTTGRWKKLLMLLTLGMMFSAFVQCDLRRGLLNVDIDRISFRVPRHDVVFVDTWFVDTWFVEPVFYDPFFPWW